MNPGKWQKIKEIFNAAVELAPDETELFLQNQNGTSAEILAEVRALLAAEKENYFEKPLGDVVRLWQDEPPEDFVGRRIGNYEIVREIGRGGMGIVFQAKRETTDFSQIVALKLLKRGMDSDAMLRRFRHERQILASLEHPNIARLLDGGTSADGLSFFAMEFVEGKPLDEFCDGKKLNIPERLRLFLQICAAVSFAHSQLVVHRDLKPTNIFVTAGGTVKLLDFGIAKIISPDNDSSYQTVTALGMMTPAYASPEQISGKIVSTASDVYSLGLILYELLTGISAYKFPDNRPDEIARVVCESEPVRPSSAVSSMAGWSTVSEKTDSRVSATTNPKSKIQNPKFLKGDLDNIILKALRKEPTRRYASVEQFAGDIWRHLAGLPVTARPDTFSYRFEKFVKRNAVSVASATLVFLILVGAVVGIYSQYVRAERQRVLAESRFADVRQLANNVVFKYHDEIQNLPGSTKAREMLVKDALVYLNRLSSDEGGDISLTIELAQAFMKIGDVQGQAYEANLGDTTGAIESYRKAVVLLENAATQNAGDLKTQNELATAYQKISALIGRGGNQQESLEFAEKAVALGERLAAASPSDNEQRLKLAGFYLYLGDNLPDEFAHEKSIEIFQKALQIGESALEIEPANPLAMRRIVALTQRIGSRNFLLAENASATGDNDASLKFYRASLPFYQRSLDAAKKLFAVDSGNTIYRRTLSATKINLAQAQRELGETDAALAAQREVLHETSIAAEADAANVEAQSDLASVFEDIARTFTKRRQFAKAFDNFRQAQALFDAAIEKNPNSREYFISRYNLIMRFGDALAASDDFKEAIKTYRSAFEEIKAAPMLQDAASQAFYEGGTEEKIGDCLSALAAKNASVAERRKYLQTARDAYQTSLELWRQPECRQKNFARNAGKIEFVAKKLADCVEKIRAA